MLADLLRKFAAYTQTSGLPVIRGCGRVWHLTETGAEFFGADCPAPERWVAEGKATVVKANPARTVYRVELPNGPVFVKHCRVKGLRAWGREVIRMPKARLEFENARTLRKRGVPAVEPLAWGAPDSRWPGESFLITRAVTAAIPFRHYLEQVLPALPHDEQQAVRRQVAVEFGQFLANLHDAGVTHPDPHPGNLLVEMSAARMPHFTLTDLHDVQIGSPLDAAESRHNLALFNRWFQMRSTRTDRVRFWHVYRRSRVTLPLPSRDELTADAKELERDTLASNLRLWVGRERRWTGAGREIRKLSRGPFRGLAVRDLPEDFLRQMLENPDAAFAPDSTARILKDSPGSTVAVLEMPTPNGPVAVVLKRVNAPHWTDPLKNLFRRSQVVRSWANGHALRDRWLPTPRPLAVFHRYRRGLPAEGYLLTEVVPNAEPLRTGCNGLAISLARILRAMHDRGVSHRDLKAPNILLAHGTDPTLIDLVGVRTRVTLTIAKRVKQLARLSASFATDPTATHSARLQFLWAYLRAGPTLQGDWKSWWKMVSRATVAKVARNRRTGRVLG